MSLKDLGEQFVDAFRKGDYDQTGRILPQIKLELAKAGLMIPQRSSSKDDLMAARHVLELGALAAIHRRDEDEMNRLIAQIRPFYASDLGLAPSKNENKLLALYLLLLVSKNEIAEFHTELEALEILNPESDEFLAYPIRLERWLMEGSYDKVWRAITQESEFPSSEFAILAESLIYAVRAEIAACMEQAYESLPLSNARHLLFFATEQDMADFVAQQPGWTLIKSKIHFAKEDKVPASNEIDISADDAHTVHHTQLSVVDERNVSERLIANMLGYAQQIETII